MTETQELIERLFAVFQWATATIRGRNDHLVKEQIAEALSSTPHMALPERDGAPVNLDGATPDQVDRANRAVHANLKDGVAVYESAQGYACALTAIMQSDMLIRNMALEEAAALADYWCDSKLADDIRALRSVPEDDADAR